MLLNQAALVLTLLALLALLALLVLLALLTLWPAPLALLSPDLIRFV